MRFAFIKCQGSGNDFPLIDARGIALDDAGWATVARTLADRDGPVGGDGLLLLVDGRDGAAFGQVMRNPDGTEAETCLNGLRCTARLGFEVLGIDGARASLPRSAAEVARVAPLAPGVTTIRTEAGPVSVRAGAVGLAAGAETIIDTALPGLPSARAFTAVAMPNPHLIAFVDAIDEAELVTLGDWCEAAPPLLPRRANVSFVTHDRHGLYVRTYERGVGLTDSCGSAMGASVHAAGITGRIGFGEDVTVRNRGGWVRASASGPAEGGRVTLAGNATFLYDGEAVIDLEAGRVEQLVIHHRRLDESAAWDAARARAA